MKQRVKYNKLVKNVTKSIKPLAVWDSWSINDAGGKGVTVVEVAQGTK